MTKHAWLSPTEVSDDTDGERRPRRTVPGHKTSIHHLQLANARVAQKLHLKWRRQYTWNITLTVSICRIRDTSF